MDTNNTDDILILNDVIQKGSCCRKGGRVKLIETIPSGTIPNPNSLGLVYEAGTKAFRWASQPFNRPRKILQYVDTGKFFLLDGKFFGFIQDNNHQVQQETYVGDTPLTQGQIWSVKMREGIVKILLREEVRGGFLLSHQIVVEGEDAWVPSDHRVSIPSIRNTLHTGEGRLVEANAIV